MFLSFLLFALGSLSKIIPLQKRTDLGGEYWGCSIMKGVESIPFRYLDYEATPVFRIFNIYFFGRKSPAWTIKK